MENALASEQISTLSFQRQPLDSEEISHAKAKQDAYSANSSNYHAHRWDNLRRDIRTLERSVAMDSALT